MEGIFKDPIHEIPAYNVTHFDSIHLKEGCYIDMLNSWAKLNYKEPTSIQETIKQPLWRTSLILIDGKTVTHNEWNEFDLNIFFLI